MSAPILDQVNALRVEVWALWVRTYGAAGAIRLALSSGYTQKEIRAANDEALRIATRGAP